MAGADSGDRWNTVNRIEGSVDNAVQARDIDTINFTTNYLPPTPPTAKPWTVPAPPSTFVDRDDHLDVVHALAGQQQAEPAVVVFSGLAGIGKSALLHKSAAVLRDQFGFEVALYADFLAGDFTLGGTPALSDVLGGLLGDLGVGGESMPAHLPGRQRQFRSATSDRRVLVGLDNVREAGQVQALTPNSTGSLVLAASELRLEELALDDAHLVEVPGLDAPDGARLLAALCDTMPLAPVDAVDRLLSMCGGHPLALRIAAVLLRSGRWQLDRLLAELDGDGGLNVLSLGRGRHIAAPFLAAYQQLSPDAARLLRVLGQMPGPGVERHVAAAMVDATAADVDEWLDELHRAHLVDGHDAVTMHAIVRRFAMEVSLADHPAYRYSATRVGRWADAWLSAGDDDALLRRAAAGWVQRAAAADAAVGPRYRVAVHDIAPEETFADDVSAMAWFNEHHDTLHAVLRDAASRGWDDVAWPLFEALWPYYMARKPLRAWTEAGELAVRSAERAGDVRATARVRCLLARAYLEQKRFPHADVQLAAATREAESTDDQRLVASVLDFAGQSRIRQDDPAGALALFERALAINEELGNDRGIALQAQFAGRCHGLLGDHDAALALFDRARALIEPLDDRRTLARIELSAGRVLASAGRDAEAAAGLDRSLRVAADLGLDAHNAEALELLADLAARAGDVPGERRNLAAAVAILRRTGSPRTEALQARLDSLPAV